MFSPTSKPTIFTFTLLLLAVIAGEQTYAQQAASAQFQARMAAMQHAQARAEVVERVVQAPERVARAPVARVAQAPKATAARKLVPARRVSAPVAKSNQRVVGAGYKPQHDRTAQLISEGTIIDGGSPIMGQSVIMQQPMMHSPVIEHSVVSPVMQHDAGVIYGDEVVISDSCNTCGDSESYFVDDCCGRGGCGDVPCWWDGTFGRALRNGSYFFGATAFRHQAYKSPFGTDLVQDSNFGAYGGFNLGIPLCRLTGGVLSGQFGVRSVQTNFQGNEIASDTRDQTFLTAGLYRRSDYGLQAGLVVDVLVEDYFVESTIAQLRGELSWAYPNGGALGFRFTNSQQEDISDGVFAGQEITDFQTFTQDHYRFFLRKVSISGGWEELYAGWTDNDQAVLGADFDIPLAQYMSLEAGAVYYLSELQDQSANLGNTRIDDAFNIYVGFAFRPQGRAYYRSYDRPLLPVADNGTMLIRRDCNLPPEEPLTF